MAYSEGHEVVTVCDSEHVVGRRCDDTEMSYDDMLYWDDFNLVLTCERCLKWKGL